MPEDDIIRSAAERLFRDAADIQDVLAARDEGWKDRLWAGIEEMGLTRAAAPEALGGADIGLHAALGVLRAAGGAALSTPLAETMLAGWMLGAAGLEAPAGRTAFGPAGFDDALRLDPSGALSGRVARLPFARDCAHAALLVEGEGGLHVALIALDRGAEGLEIAARESLAFEAVDRVTLRGLRPLACAPAPAGFTPDAALLMGAAARSMQIAGALERILSLTCAYAMQRRAFERPLSKFQAVQHQLAELAGEAAVSLSAAESAAEALESRLGEGAGFDDPELRLEVISARLRTAEAARKGAAIAHQLHGAIGVTREHVLHRLTLRALAWRDDYGEEGRWSERLGAAVCAGGAEALWPLLAAR